MLRTRSTPRRLNENGNSTRRHSSGRGVGFHVSFSVSPQPAPSCSSSAAENVAVVCRAAPTSVHNPHHDTRVIARPSQPSHESSAPNTTNSTTATICHARCSTASSVVSHAEKKLNAMSHSGRRGGRSATRVNVAPTIETTRNQAELLTGQR